MGTCLNPFILYVKITQVQNDQKICPRSSESRGVRNTTFQTPSYVHIPLAPQDEKDLNNFANVIKGLSTKSLSVIIQNKKFDHIQAKQFVSPFA